MVKAIIVEDSRLARVELKSQLAAIDYIECVGEAENVEQALTLYQAVQPDLIFLDINLPDGNGFEFLTQIAQSPYVIFTTAFEEYALKAFDNEAIDYLLKPYTQQRLTQACEKVKALAEHDSSPLNTMMSLASQFFVKDGHQCWLIKLEQVERFEAMGNYTRVYFEDKKPMVYRTLAQVESRLPRQSFFRISRQNIVQLNCVADVKLCSSGGLELTLRSGDKVEVSRRQASVFKSLLAL